MKPKFSAVLTYQGKGSFPALRGQLFENGGHLIGTFSRGRASKSYVPPIVAKFRTDAAKARFQDFADCLSVSESIEALVGFLKVTK